MRDHDHGDDAFGAVDRGVHLTLREESRTFVGLSRINTSPLLHKARAIAMHRLHPVIDRTFPFAEAKAAYRHFEGRGNFGKVVITHS